jgi:hypothetical protein
MKIPPAPILGSALLDLFPSLATEAQNYLSAREKCVPEEAAQILGLDMNKAALEDMRSLWFLQWERAKWKQILEVTVNQGDQWRDMEHVKKIVDTLFDILPKMVPGE